MAIQLLERETLHPSHGDQVFGGKDSGYARFRFFTAEGESWAGAFAGTGINNNTFARSFGPAGDVLVVARGQGYVVNVPRRALRFTAEPCPGDYLFDARAVPGRDLIVACSCDCLCAYSSEGEQWVGEDFGGDGVGLGEVTETEVSGWHWQPGAGWYGFSLLVDGFRLRRGGLLDYGQLDYPDPGINHPPPVLPQDSVPPGTRA
jgi:hypothetical protein